MINVTHCCPKYRVMFKSGFCGPGAFIEQGGGGGVTTRREARYELASARDMSSSSSFMADRIGRTCMPNLRHILRDKMHACRRVLMQRPWSADPTLNDLTTVFAMGHNSLLQLVHQSEVFQGWLAEFSAKNDSKVVDSVFSSIRAA